MRYLLGVLLVLSFAAPLAAAEAVGTVKTLSGSAFVERGGDVVELTVGAPIQVDDRLVTRNDGSLGLILQDDTTISLGPNSELLLRDFVFEPQQNRFSLILKMLRGTFLYVSGVIGKLAPDSIKLETPDSTIAVRGTRVLVRVSN
jgi:hypothetical protein